MKKLITISILTVMTGCLSMDSSQALDPGNQAEISWYYFNWLASSPYAPVFQVLDTESSLGPYADKTKTITIKDLVKMHGHPCDGLVTASCALFLGFKELYPDGVIDRTDTYCITNNSPCYGDVAEYLSGGRIRFGTQKIDPGLGNEFILYRPSINKAVKISLKKNIFPERVANLEKLMKSGSFTLKQMRRCQELEWEYARNLVNRPLKESFRVDKIPGFTWKSDTYIHAGSRSDIINKNALNNSL